MGLVGGGGYAEFATAWAHHLMTVPETLTWAQAASVSETYIPTAEPAVFPREKRCPRGFRSVFMVFSLPVKQHGLKESL